MVDIMRNVAKSACMLEPCCPVRCKGFSPCTASALRHFNGDAVVPNGWLHPQVASRLALFAPLPSADVRLDPPQGINHFQGFGLEIWWQQASIA